MDPTDLQRRRLARQALTAPLPTPEAAVRRLLAMQAQDLGQVRWALAARSTGRADALEAALSARTVVRTWPMRGTLHLVAAEDARWLLRLLAPRALRGVARRRADLGLDADTVARARDLLTARLQGGASATRDELLAALEAGGVPPTGQRGYHLLSTLAQEGLLVQAALREGEPTFALLDEWLPASPGPDGDEALAALARRYVDGHGPASAADLAWWSGLPVTTCRTALRDLAGLRADGERYLPDDDAPPPHAGAHLLAGYDELHLGYRDREALLDPAHADRVCPGGNGVFRPTVVVDGRMVGTWRAKVGARAVTVEPAWFAGPPAVDLGPALARYAAFVGRADARWA